jgi:hypothetical protein
MVPRTTAVTSRVSQGAEMAANDAHRLASSPRRALQNAEMRSSL